MTSYWKTCTIWSAREGRDLIWWGQWSSTQPCNITSSPAPSEAAYAVGKETGDKMLKPHRHCPHTLSLPATSLARRSYHASRRMSPDSCERRIETNAVGHYTGNKFSHSLHLLFKLATHLFFIYQQCLCWEIKVEQAFRLSVSVFFFKSHFTITPSCPPDPLPPATVVSWGRWRDVSQDWRQHKQKPLNPALSICRTLLPCVFMGFFALSY